MGSDISGLPILCRNASVTIDNCVFLDLTPLVSISADAVVLSSAGGRIVDNVFDNTTISSFGHAIEARGSHPDGLVISGNRIVRSSGSFPNNGIRLYSITDLQLDHNLITKSVNVGLYLEDCSGVVANNTFSLNGTGLFVASGSGLDIRNNIFAFNSVSGS